MEEVDNTIVREFNLPEDVINTLEKEASDRGIPEDEVITDLMRDGFWVAFHDVEESVVRLKYIDPWTEVDKLVTPPTPTGETPNTLRAFRRLREEFPPVSAGVEYSKSFTSGGGFTVEISNADDKNQQESKKIVNELNKNIYQDDVTIGLDAILDILIDEAFTVGSAAAEIVYEAFDKPGSFTFEDWARKIPNAPDGEPQWESKAMEDPDWKSLKGIAQLKIIDNAVERLKPYINPYTYKIEYWTIDEVKASDGKEKTEPIKLLPWQVLWLSWGRRGSNLKGVSLVRPVAQTALLLEEILKAVGTSFKRWSDKKYFFILGDPKSGRSWQPVKIREFMHDTKKMIEQGGSAIPVSVGFDIKEIGGEAYAGGSIIDNLISMICGGMRYPRTFLEQGKTQEGDKAWLAWIVTYATHQKLLRRAIEHQLWERQLYCKLGTKQRLSVQGKKIEEQELVSVYVPSMEWKSEGKWHISEKLKQLTSILNVANPVGPELKTEVEADIATTLSYSELDLTNARKILQINQKVGLIEAETDEIKAQMIKESMENAQKKKLHLDMIPIITGLKEEEPEPENPKRPPPVPLQRLMGGVSRSKKETGTESTKGVSKPLGGTRQPNPKTGAVEETVEFESYDELFSVITRLETQARKNELFERMIEVLDKMTEV